MCKKRKYRIVTFLTVETIPFLINTRSMDIRISFPLSVYESREMSDNLAKSNHPFIRSSSDDEDIAPNISARLFTCGT